MYKILKDIIYKKAHINTFHISTRHNKNCFTIKETALNAECKEINLIGLESSSTTFGFELDTKGIKKISPYFENKKGLDKGNDGIIFTTIKGKRYVFICELKDGAKGHIAQFKSTSCFVDYLKSILKRFYGTDTSDLIFKYIVFSKHGSNIQDVKGNYICRKNISGFDVYNMKCCNKVEYYIERFI